MWLVDTNVIAEARKGAKGNAGVRRFFEKARVEPGAALFISVITLGEIRRGVELLRHRGDAAQARPLEAWLNRVVADYSDRTLEFGPEEAQLWGRLCVPHAENAIDKQIAATALMRDLELVTRNTRHFNGMGLRVMNPFK